MVIRYYGTTRGSTPDTLKEGDIVWSALYEHSYSGNSCSAKIEPIEMKCVKKDNVFIWVRPHNNRKIKTDHRRYFFKTEAECRKYYDKQLNNHLRSLDANFMDIVNSIDHVYKQIHDKSTATQMGEIKETLKVATEKFNK